MFKKSKATLYLLIANILIFFLEPVLPMDYLMFVPAYSIERPWSFVTAMFLHANFTHLFFNMFALFLFGIYLESKIGSRKFLLGYFLSGIIGNLGFLLLSPNSTIPALGASGAIYGVLGTLAILEPTLIIYVDFIPMPMIVAAIIWLLTSLAGIFGPPTGIGYQAHLFGLLFGFFYGYYLKREEKNKPYTSYYYYYYYE